MANVIQKTQPIIDKINQAIKLVLSEETSIINDIALYSFQSGGKRIRPLLYCLTIQTLNGKLNKKNLLLASSFEIIHLATLLHDDIIDGANLRRGQEASHLVYGQAETVLAGDYLFAKAIKLSSLANNMDCLLLMTTIAQALSLGELLQLNNSHNLNLTEEIYLEIINNKTATLISSAVNTAAIFMEAPKKIKKALNLFGNNIGLAFQIIDDILDYKSTANEFGKPVGHDLDEGKITLPFIICRDNLNETDKEKLFKLAQQETRTTEEFKIILKFFDKTSAIEKSYNKAYNLVIEANEAIDILPKSKSKKFLQDLAYYLIERKF